jgi:hypothetical protein
MFAFAEVAPSLPAIKRATACKSPMTVGVGDLPALERPPLRFAASALKKSEISLVGLAKLLAKSKAKKSHLQWQRNYEHALNSSILLSYGHNVMRTYTGFKTARSQV